MNLAGSSVVVTGAGRGIGRATSLALAARGAGIVLVSRTASEIAALAEEIRSQGGRALPIAADLMDPQAPRRIVDAAVDAFGGLQILVNNAGVARHVAFSETSDDDWDTTLATNLTAPFRLTRQALPELSKQGGHVIMISSLAGKNPVAGLSAYCASKAALDHLAACLMLEVRSSGVKVTTIAPGSVATSFGDDPRPDPSWMLVPEDVALALVSLLEGRDQAHLSRVEMRPARPPKRP